MNRRLTINIATAKQTAGWQPAVQGAAILIALCLGALSSVAQKPATQTKKQACADLTAQNDMNRCAADEYKKADAELNKVYQQLLPKLEGEHKEKLKVAQRAWLAFRDAHCEFEAFSFEGGSMQPLMRDSCLEAVTRERTKQLRGALQEAAK
ncbi:MAG: DUF1311 domain-containing protein [Acidobacteria bacterium]|nr:DUF1311 domain-containing protein [Acidobacteriota bacterium]MBI3421967.1 DUF1311 domain-containing protein [Acidobacteriota bacterium]